MRVSLMARVRLSPFFITVLVRLSCPLDKLVDILT